MANPSVCIFVINLDRRTDRLESITRNLDRLGLAAVRVAATDARIVTDAELGTRVRLDGQVLRIGRGSESNILSHCRAMEMFLATSTRAALVLEDDAELASDLPHFLDSLDWWPESTGLVKLEAYGRTYAVLDRQCSPAYRGRQLRPIALRSGGSAGYMIDRDAAQTVLSLCRDIPLSIDNVLFDLRVSGIARKLRPVQLLPGLVRQRVAEFESDVESRRTELLPSGLERRWRRLRWNVMTMPRKAVVKGRRLCGLAERVWLEFADRWDGETPP